MADMQRNLEGQPAVTLDHGWLLVYPPGLPPQVLNEFYRDPVHAIPVSMAERIGPCRITVVDRLEDPEATSEWTWLEDRLEMKLVSAPDPHDTALELLFCVGQALWETLTFDEAAAYMKLLAIEFQAGVEGEIDEDAYREKAAILSSRRKARSPERMESYAGTSFASTAAEFVHALWHDVTVRSGREHLPPRQLRARLEMIASWFPPERGYRLFP